MNSMKVITIGVDDNLENAYIDFGNNELSTNHLMYIFGMITSILVTEEGVSLDELQDLVYESWNAFKIEEELIN